MSTYGQMISFYTVRSFYSTPVHILLLSLETPLLIVIYLRINANAHIAILYGACKLLSQPSKVNLLFKTILQQHFACLNTDTEFINFTA